MRCNNCNRKVVEGQIYCMFCGSKLATDGKVYAKRKITNILKRMYLITFSIIVLLFGIISIMSSYETYLVKKTERMEGMRLQNEAEMLCSTFSNKGEYELRSLLEAVKSGECLSIVYNLQHRSYSQNELDAYLKHLTTASYIPIIQNFGYNFSETLVLDVIEIENTALLKSLHTKKTFGEGYATDRIWRLLEIGRSSGFICEKFKCTYISISSIDTKSIHVYDYKTDTFEVYKEFNDDEGIYKIEKWQYQFKDDLYEAWWGPEENPEKSYLRYMKGNVRYENTNTTSSNYKRDIEYAKSFN